MQETLFSAGVRQIIYAFRGSITIEHTKKGVYIMMMLGTYLRRWQRWRRHLLEDEKTRQALRFGAVFALGFCLSAASLNHLPQPVAMAVLCAGLPGWLPIPFALGAAGGYWLFWGNVAGQSVIWIAAALPACVIAGWEKGQRRLPLLQPMLSAAIVAVSGVAFQIMQGEPVSILLYFLRIGMAFGVTALTIFVRRHRDTPADWVAAAVLELALAQIAPLPFLGLGFVAAGMLTPVLAFPGVALVGLAMDLAQVTPVPMTAVLCLTALLRLLLKTPRFWQYMAPAAIYLVVMGLCGTVDLLPVPALLLGGCCSRFLPERPGRIPRRGETGSAQVRLEMAAHVMSQTEKLLLEAEETPIDAPALVAKAVDRACSTCPSRKDCKDRAAANGLTAQILQHPLIRADDVPVACKKRSRLMLELRRSQDQYRTLKADRERQQEYRVAVIQQYRFLSEFLQDLADQLPRRGQQTKPKYQPEVAVCSTGKELANGDRCLWFAGPENRYYLLLCDGMGTGPGAAAEARAAGDMLRQLLMAGYPAAYALRSINSLCTLRLRAGAVTMDLAEVHLDSGKVMLYKWGAAPSWVLSPNGAGRIGEGGPPPGISVTVCTETVDRLSLRHGQMLVLLSDGVDDRAIAEQIDLMTDEPPGSLAAKLLDAGRLHGTDDATAAVLRLMPIRKEE